MIIIIICIIISVMLCLLLACVRQAKGRSTQPGVGAVVRRWCTQWDNTRSAERTRTRDTEMHTKCSVYEMWQAAACEENIETTIDNAGSSRILIQSLPQTVFCRRNYPTSRCAPVVHEFFRFACNSKTKPGGVDDCVWWIPFVSSAPYLRLHPLAPPSGWR